jgi:hypothetical protein
MPPAITRSALGNFKSSPGGRWPSLFPRADCPRWAGSSCLRLFLPELLFVNFNQDNTSVSVGTRKGYGIVNCDPFGRVYARSELPTSAALVSLGIWASGHPS